MDGPWITIRTEHEFDFQQDGRAAKKRVTVQSPIDRALLEPLGRVTANFALLEEVLAIVICFLLYENSEAEKETGRIVTAELSFRRKVQLFSALFVHRFPEKGIEQIKELRASLCKAEENRNIVIHSGWEPTSDRAEGQSVRKKTTAKRKGLSTTTQVMDQEGLDEVAAQIGKATAELLAFMPEVRDGMQSET